MIPERIEIQYALQTTPKGIATLGLEVSEAGMAYLEGIYAIGEINSYDYHRAKNLLTAKLYKKEEGTP